MFIKMNRIIGMDKRRYK